MGVTPPGWYEDQDDPALARWWDGDRWTEHTLVIADQVPDVQPPPPPGYDQGAGSEAFLDDEGDWTRLEEDDPWGEGAADETASVFAPIPVPGATPSAEAAETSVFAFEDDEAPVFGGAWEVQEPLAGRPTGRGGWGDQLRDLPPWMRVAVPAAVVLLLILVVAASGVLGGGDDDPETGDEGTRTTALDPVRLRSAALLAVRVADVPSLTTSTFTELIPLACEAAREDDPDPLVDEIEQLDLDDPTVDRLLVGLDAGADDYCEDDMEANPGLISDVYRALGVTRSGTTVSSTSSSSSSSTSSSSTTPTTRATTTTRRPNTTAPPPTVTTTTTAPTTTTTAAEPTTTTTVTPTTTP